MPPLAPLLLWAKHYSLALLFGALLGLVWLCMVREWWGRRLPWWVWSSGVALGIGYALRRL